MPAIYLIRHEEPELRGRFIGRTDPPLTAQGCDAAASKLSALDVKAVYVSPLRRARQTAQAIACATPHIVLPQLAEIDFGEWEGLSWSEIEDRWPGAAVRKIEDWLGVPPPGGESWAGPGRPHARGDRRPHGGECRLGRAAYRRRPQVFPATIWRDYDL